MRPYNNELAEIDTPEKAYLLGLFYSDGCIHHSNSYVSSIVLHEDDLYLLQELKRLFPFFIISKMKSKAYALRCTRKALFSDLINHGMYQRKSTDNKELLTIPKLNPNLFSHFIRGYFDGDGGVYKQKVGNTKIEIGGTSFRLITDIIKVLYDNKITVNLRCKYAGTGLRTQDYYILYTSSDKVSKEFANFIYKDCNDLCLKRKKDKLSYIPEYYRMERLVCPLCGGINTVRNGSRKMLHGLVYRGYCKDCNKQFSITAPLSSNIQSGGDELLEG